MVYYITLRTYTFLVVSLGIFSVVPATEPCAMRSTQSLKVSTSEGVAGLYLRGYRFRSRKW